MLGNQCAYVNLWIPSVVFDKHGRKEALDPVETLCIPCAVNVKPLSAVMRMELTNCSTVLVLHRPRPFLPLKM